MKQLSFEHLNRTGQTSQTVQANPSVSIEEAPRLKHQTQKILAALRQGPLTTRSLRVMAAQYNARLKEARMYLKRFGLTVDLVAKAKDGNNTYAIRDFHGSRYEAELMAKQAKKGMRMREIAR